MSETQCIVVNNKPISKSLRFQILKRDGYRCRYCGKTASETELHVDHVLPRVLGGSNDPLNLVAACIDCNGGKSTKLPGTQIVEDLTSEMRKQLDAFDELADVVRRRNALVENTCQEFSSHWYRGSLPEDWKRHIGKFIESGLPPHVIIDMVDVAQDKFGEMGWRWAYFYGCCRNRLKELTHA